MRVNYIIYPFVSMFSSPCRIADATTASTPVLPGARLTDEAIHCIAPVLAELFAAALAQETNKKSEA